MDLVATDGTSILRVNMNRYYDTNFKPEMISRILINHESLSSDASEIGLSSTEKLTNWIQQYNEFAYNVIEK